MLTYVIWFSSCRSQRVQTVIFSFEFRPRSFWCGERYTTSCDRSLDLSSFKSHSSASCSFGYALLSLNSCLCFIRLIIQGRLYPLQQCQGTTARFFRYGACVPNVLSLELPLDTDRHVSHCSGEPRSRWCQRQIRWSRRQGHIWYTSGCICAESFSAVTIWVLG